jgi:hypothetical protein
MTNIAFVNQDRFPQSPIGLEDAKTTSETEASGKTATIASGERPLDSQKSPRDGLMKRAWTYRWPHIGTTGKTNKRVTYTYAG